MISGVTSAASAGINAGLRQLDSAAQAVASGGVTDIKALTEALVSGQQAKLQVAAAVKMLSTADETLGTLIDSFA